MSELIEKAPRYLKRDAAEEFVKTLFTVQKRCLDRIEEDISWFVEKFKYENRDADWKDSKDAIPRTIQKLSGALLDSDS